MAHPGHDDAGTSAHTVPRQALASRLHSPRARRAGRIRVLSRDQLMNRPEADTRLRSKERRLAWGRLMAARS